MENKKKKDKGLSKEELLKMLRAMKPGDELKLVARSKWETNNKC